MPRAVTYNAPGRYGVPRMAANVQSYANGGATVIGVNEVADSAVARMCPRGWEQHRPTRERSSALYWDPEEWRAKLRGAYQVHSPDWRTPRFIVWALLEHQDHGDLVKFGAVQLIAFKTSKPSHAAEFRHQATRCGLWLDRPGHRVLLGDLNGEAGSTWLAPLDAVATPHTPRVESGPDGQPIDWFYVAKPYPRAVRAKTLPGDSDHRAVQVEVPLPVGGSS